MYRDYSSKDYSGNEKCDCNEKAVKVFVNSAPLHFQPNEIYLCGKCFDEWKQEEKVKIDAIPEQVRKTLIEKGMPEQEANEMIKKIYNK